MSVLLRPEQPSDFALLTGGESPFDEFGPRGERTAVRPARLDDAGALVVLDQDGALAGDVAWRWVQPEGHQPPRFRLVAFPGARS
jgi:hypothetical protein